MIRRRTTEAGFKINLGCQVFRATGRSPSVEKRGGSNPSFGYPRAPVALKPCCRAGL